MDEQELRDRQMIELLNELRVALPGVQILFAFLLTVPFSMRFAKLTGFQRADYFVTLLATTAAAACLIAPSAAHRLRFHQRDRAWLVESANAMTIAGLVLLAVAMTSAVTLIADLLYGEPTTWITGAGVALLLVCLWFIRPLRRGDDSSGP
jgi:hypothetical protein